MNRMQFSLMVLLLLGLSIQPCLSETAQKSAEKFAATLSEAEMRTLLPEMKAKQVEYYRAQKIANDAIDVAFYKAAYEDVTAKINAIEKRLHIIDSKRKQEQEIKNQLEKQQKSQQEQESDADEQRKAEFQQSYNEKVKSSQYYYNNLHDNVDGNAAAAREGNVALESITSKKYDPNFKPVSRDMLEQQGPTTKPVNVSEQFQKRIKEKQQEEAKTKEPQQEITHEHGTMYFFQEMVYDIINTPMDEQTFLNYCQKAYDDVMKKYASYSDVYFAGNCKIEDNKVVAQCFVQNFMTPRIVNVSDNMEGFNLEEQKKTAQEQYKKYLEQELEETKLAIIKKSRTLSMFYQQQMELNNQLNSNTVQIVDNAATIVKKEINGAINSGLSVIPQKFVGKEDLKKVLKDKADNIVDDIRDIVVEPLDAQPQSNNLKLENVDKIIDVYNQTEKIYKNAEKFSKLAGKVISEDIPKIFDEAMNTLDGKLGHLPKSARKCVKKYVFFINNRYEIGGSAGLGAANITIYSMKKENEQQIERYEEEIQQLENKMKRYTDKLEAINNGK